MFPICTFIPPINEQNINIDLASNLHFQDYLSLKSSAFPPL